MQEGPLRDCLKAKSQQSVLIARLNDRVANLRGAVQSLLETDEWRQFDRADKSGKCPHGRFRWEGCEACIDAVLVEALRRDDELATPQPPLWAETETRA